jgi:hypothetical protein
MLRRLYTCIFIQLAAGAAAVIWPAARFYRIAKFVIFTGATPIGLVHLAVDRYGGQWGMQETGGFMREKNRVPLTLLIVGGVFFGVGLWLSLESPDGQAQATTYAVNATKPVPRLAVPPSKFIQPFAPSGSSNQVVTLTFTLGPAAPEVKLIRSEPARGNDAAGYIWNAEIAIDTKQPIMSMMVSATGKGITYIGLNPKDGSAMNGTSQQFNENGADTASYRVARPLGNYLVSVKTRQKSPQPNLTFALDAK